MATTDTSDIVNGWFTDRLAGGPLARDTLAYNQVVNALPDLIERLGASAAQISSTSEKTSCSVGETPSG